MKKVFALFASLFAGTALYAAEWIGSDDFYTLEPRGTYKSGQTEDGWTFANCIICRGLADNESEYNPKFKFLGDENTKGLVINGNTNGIGSINSPIIQGMDSLSFSYALPYKSDKCEFIIYIYDAKDSLITDSVVIKDIDLEQKKTKEKTIAIKKREDIYLSIVNNSPSKKNSHTDRVAIWDIKWSAPLPLFNGIGYVSEGTTKEIELDADTKDNPMGDNGILFFDEDIPAEIKAIPNVVCNGKAENIILKNTADLFLNEEITAENVCLQFTPKIFATTEKGWMTIVSPFDVDKITATIGDVQKEIRPIYKGASDGDFWVKTLLSSTEQGVVIFTEIEEKTLKANTPYLIAFPGSTFGESSLEGATITFSAKSATIKCADAKSESSAYTLHGSYFADDVNEAFILDSERNGFIYSKTVQTTPFEAYFSKNIDKSIRSLRIVFDDDVTSIAEVSAEGITYEGGRKSIHIYAPKSGIANIYTAEGKAVMLNKEYVAGKTTITGLEKGIYIINGAKVVVY